MTPHTTIDKIAPDIFRLSTWIPDVAPPAGFTFNQFLIRGEQPFLFHTGMRQLYPLVSEAIDRLMAPLCVKGWLFPPVDGAPVLAVVKQTALDDGCGSAR